MNLKNYKKEFTVFIYDENPVQAQFLKHLLRKDGYEAHFYTSEELFLQALYLTLPHIVILPSLEKTAALADQILKMSREIQIFAVGPAADAEKLHRLLEQKRIYDYVLEPVSMSLQFLHRVERGMESWMGRMVAEERQKVNEELKTLKIEPTIKSLTFIDSAPTTQPTEPTVDSAPLADLLLCESEEAAVRFTLKNLQDLCRKDFVYLKYDYQQETLSLVDIASGMTTKYRQIGIKLENVVDIAHFFKNSQEYKIWADFFKHVFRTDQTTVRLIQNKDVVLGVIVALGALTERETMSLEHWARGLSLIVDGQLKTRLIFNYLPVELKTFCLNNKHFYERLNSEVSRARRHKTELSVLSFELRGGRVTPVQKAVSLFAKITKRFTRSSDFVGRLGERKLAIALPQTDREQAIHVAQRLQSICQNALADKHLMDVEVVCGVSSFPSLANDAMSLLAGSEEALSQADPFEVVVYAIESMGTLDLQNDSFILLREQNHSEDTSI